MPKVSHAGQRTCNPLSGDSRDTASNLQTSCGPDWRGVRLHSNTMGSVCWNSRSSYGPVRPLWPTWGVLARGESRHRRSAARVNQGCGLGAVLYPEQLVGGAQMLLYGGLREEQPLLSRRWSAPRPRAPGPPSGGLRDRSSAPAGAVRPHTGAGVPLGALPRPGGPLRGHAGSARGSSRCG
jgi:hypothetical protein